MWKTKEGSTGRLIQLCFFYFLFYTITGVAVKYFQDYPGGPKLKGIVFLTYSTIGGTAICLLWVFAVRWYRFESARPVAWGPLRFPSEFLYIIPSGICTAVIIPTTTLLYSFKAISVMVAMVIMRGCVVVIVRAVDAIQIRQGILKRKVYFEENLAVVFALLAVGTNLFWGSKEVGKQSILQSPAALIILASYIVAYSFRLYIMNYFKNTCGKGVKQDNKGFFAVEQIAASATMFAVGAVVFFSPSLFGTAGAQIDLFRGSFLQPPPSWKWAVLAGTMYGMVAFFSVFIFMFKGRTATFAGLVNRLTSLVAGTAATLVVWKVFGFKFPRQSEWISLGFILAAVALLTLAERKRAAELAAAPKST